MGVEIGQSEFLAKEVIERPARARGIAPYCAGAEAGRGGEARSQAAFALARTDRVDRQCQCIEARRLAALDHRGIEPLVLVDIELEQLGAVGGGGDIRSEEHTSELQSHMRMS